MQTKIEIVGHHQCQLGEGPVWDARRREICWIDIVKGEIHQYNPETDIFRTYAVHEMIGCFAICNNGNFIIASKSGIGFIERASGRVNHIVNPEIHLPGNRFNDGKCDPAGRFWAGTMALTEAPGAGSLYCFDQKTIRKKIEKVTISNGLAWNRDHTTMYYIDTPTMEVVAYDYENSTGDILNRKVIFTVPKADGFPDGMTIDSEGMLWIAHWDGWQVTRWNPDTGEKLHHIKFPVARITSCTFGGKNLNDLYITSAKEGLAEAALKAQPLAGSLFVIKDCGFRGLAAVEFNNEQ